MSTEQKESAPLSSRGSASLLRRQPEIEEVEEEEDTSPGSDQSDTTITAGTETPHVPEGESPGPASPDDLKPISPTSHKLNHISPKIKQLTRSEALCEECASPPLDPLQSTASTCSTDSSSSGIGSKSVTSGSVSGSSSRGRLEKDGSQSSEAGTSSSLSRDSSVDTPYKDSTGIDLEDFIKKTLNKTPKDRSMLIKLEVDLIKFIREPKHHYLKFPQMSSYDRMLVHRIAAFFGLDHNVDQTGKCVIVNKTQNTRIPDFSFQDHIISNGGESKPKMLLKRGGGSFDELKTRNLQKPALDATRAKSLEERQQKYDEARSRIFTAEEQGDVKNYVCQATSYGPDDTIVTGIVKKVDRPQSLSGNKDDQPWSSTESSGYGTDNSGKTRILFPKANSFGGTGTFVFSHLKSPMRGGSLSKADSMSMGVGALQPNTSQLMRPMLMSSPTCSQSDTSSVSGGSSSGLAPSPHQQATPAGSLPVPGQQLFWIASDLSSIPAGSVVINPQTGQPFVNPDGSTFRYIPGQPLPTATGYTQAAQPQQMFTVQQQQQQQQQQSDWTTSQVSQDSQSSQEVCQQLSVMRVTPQSSLDSGLGAGDSGQVPQPQQPVVLSQTVPQQQPQQPQTLPQQPQPFIQQQQQQPMAGTNQPQAMYYPGAANMPGQPAVRYMCSMNYAAPGTSPVAAAAAAAQQGFIAAQSLPVDASNQAQQQQFQTHQQYCSQYVQGYNQMYPLSSQQGQQQGQPGCEMSYPCGYSVTSPVEGQGLVMSTGYNYGVPCNQQTAGTPAHSQMFYSVHTPQSNPLHSYSYSGQQASTYQTNTPPSQTSNVNPNVQLNTISAQPVNVNNMSNVNTVNIPQPQPPGLTPAAGAGSGLVGSTGGSAAVSQGTQLISYPSSHTQPYHHPAQSFTTPLRPAVTPQVVPLPSGVQLHGQTPTPQTFHPVYRPNMQMPMQIHAHSQSQSQATGSKSPQQPTPHSHVTVSAKCVSYESTANGGSGKVENGSGEGPDVAIVTEAHVASANIVRPQVPSNTGEIRLQYQPQYRAQVHPVQFTQQQQAQPHTKSPTAPKPQRVKKARSRDSQPCQTSTESGSMAMSTILEVCDLPQHLRRSEVDQHLHDLILAGAKLQFVSAEQQGDFNSNNQTISQDARVFAVFPDIQTATVIFNSHTSKTYRLVPVESIAD